MVYQPVLFGLLLCGAETWFLHPGNKLDQFSSSTDAVFITITYLAISRTVQWKDHLTTAELAD